MRRVLVFGSLVSAVLALAACASDDGPDFEVANTGTMRVTIQFGDGAPDEIDPDGGLVVLGGGCAATPVTATFENGTDVTITKPPCPGSRLTLDDGTWRMDPATTAPGP